MKGAIALMFLLMVGTRELFAQSSDTTATRRDKDGRIREVKFKKNNIGISKAHQAVLKEVLGTGEQEEFIEIKQTSSKNGMIHKRFCKLP